MNVWQSLVEALESISANKLRSSLTILGIVIGVAAVVAMIGIGRGAESSITSEIQGIGANSLYLFSGSEAAYEDDAQIINIKPLTMADARALLDPLNAPSVKYISPKISTDADITFGKRYKNTTVTGIAPAIAMISNLQVSEGEFITEAHMLGRSSVVVIGPKIGIKLFGRAEALVGEMVRINGQPFRIIGVLKSRGGSGGTSDADNAAYVPITTAQNRLIYLSEVDQVDVINIGATSADTVKSAKEEVAQIIRMRHRSPIGRDDFTILSQQQFVEAFKSVTKVLTVFLGGIAGISLLVGGIGIMNIMLVSVTERTREIGLRKALGARKSDILVQFLAESSLLSLLGGIIGVLLAIGISSIVAQVATAQNANFTPKITSDAVLLATAFSTVIGLFFGLYPANRAASLVPVEALRSE